jgi:hypothetical protein
MTSRLTVSSLFLPSLLALAGCAPQEPGGVSRRWIVGFGYVDTCRDRAVDSQSLSAVGVIAGQSGVQAGLILSHRTSIDPSLAGDSITEVTASPLRLSIKSRDVSNSTTP